MDLYLLVAVASAVLAVGAGIWDGRRLHCDARYSPVVIAITAGGPVISLALFLVVGGIELKPVATLGLVAIGAVAGAYVARLAQLSVAEPEERSGEAGEPLGPSEAVAKGGAPDPAGRPDIRIAGASLLPLPAAIAVAALQISSAAGQAAWEVLSLAALEAAVAFGVASAVVLVRRRAQLGRALEGTDGAQGFEPRATA
jgi:hypothetical protein